MRLTRRMRGKKPLLCALLLGSACLRTPKMQGQAVPPDGAGQSAPVAPSVDMQRSAAIDRRIPQQTMSTVGALQGIVMDQAGRPLVGVEVRLTGGGAVAPALSSGDGIFRVLRVPPGSYQMTLTPRGGSAVQRPGVEIHAGEVLSIEVHLPVAEKGPVSVLGRSLRKCSETRTTRS